MGRGPPMPRHLRREGIVTSKVLSEKGENHGQVARLLGVREGTVRDHLRRAAFGAIEGRCQKPFRAEAIAAWVKEHDEAARPVYVRDLYEHLVAEHGYPGSYNSVVRLVRSRDSRPRIRTYWPGEDPGNRGGDGPADGHDRSECGRGDDGPAHPSPHGPPPDRPSGGDPLPRRFAVRAPPLFRGRRPFLGSRASGRRRSAQEKLVSSRPARPEQGACHKPPSPDAPRGASLEDVPAALRLRGDRQPPDFGRGSASGASLSAVLGAGARSMSMTVTSGGERNRIGGPQVPVPRLV